MRKFHPLAGVVRLSLPLLVVALAASCSKYSTGTENAVNPLLPEALFDEVPDTRQPVAQIDSLDVSHIPGGLILVVNATAAAQGAHSVGLRALSAEPVNGVARYALVAYQSGDPTRPVVGPVQTRRITAATRLSDTELANISQIEVSGAQNTLSVRP